MPKDELKNRFRIALETNEKRPVDLCKDLKLAKSTVSQYLSGKSKNMDADRLQSICQYLNVSEAWMMGYDVPMERQFPIPGAIPITKRKIPVLGQIACGEPTFAAEIEFEDTTDSPIDADFALYAKGDSMINARINDGDLVFVKRMDKVENGDIAVVLIDDEATLKRFYYYEDTQTVQLVAENPAYRPIVISGPDAGNVRVIGKAVTFQSEVK